MSRVFRIIRVIGAILREEAGSDRFKMLHTLYIHTHKHQSTNSHMETENPDKRSE